MAPFHPLRYEARALVARALAGSAVFLAIAVALLAGVPAVHAEEPLPDAQTGQPLPLPEAAPIAPAPEPVQPDPEPVAPEPEPIAPEPVVPDPAEPGPVQHGHGHDDEDDNGPPWGRGGGGKWDPPDPRAPGSPPPGSAPAPAPQPAPAPGVESPGRGNDDDDELPQQTGAGGKGNGVAEPAPQANTPDPAQPTAPASPSDPAPGPSAPAPAESGLGAESPGGEAGDRVRRLRVERTARRERSGGAAPTEPGLVAGVGGTEAAFEPAPAIGAGAFEPVGEAANGGDGSANPTDRRARPDEAPQTRQGPPIIRTIPALVEEVPAALKFALATTGVLSILLAFGYLLTSLRNRSLARQRRDLLQEVGLLQSALLPPVPERVGGLRTSVAYRPADGPGAGGDFYDVLPLPGGRVGFILGDVSGHGRGALARTAFMRYTLRAYLEAGLEPRVALQVAGRVIDENLGGDFATVLLAVHDPATGSLTYAAAGHPAPIVIGPHPHDPVTAASSPPIGVGVRTGLRQTTVPLEPGSIAAMFTDGLLEARTEGGMLGRDRLEELLEELGDDVTARGLIQRVDREARVLSDDIAAVVIQPTNAATAGLFRSEQLELTARELEGPTAARFLHASGVPSDEAEAAIHDARALAERFGGVILHVVFGNRLRVEVLPRNVESIEAASRRAAAAR